MNIFEESISILKSKSKLRALFKNIHIEDISNVLSRIQSVLTEKKNEVELQAVSLQEKQEYLKVIIQQMKAHNISLDELNASLAGKATRKRRSVQRMTFRYETNGGDEIIWQGSNAGRIPSNFASYLERTGKKRLDCIVE
ncbi:MAG: H-NS histone family protein [Endozoicomonadaceae bacterium]|nr:H-NS histone family protein [Endozoicomonadaceae bacterium]